MNPFYFGDSQTPLYGVLHEPSDGPYRERAVLICEPIGHEYFRSHRMLQLLAQRLSEIGYYCLRFDYSGTGDSCGEFSDMDLSIWQQDVVLAADELRAVSGTSEVVCVGLRIGALLALEANLECGFCELILWDPVVSGATYLSQLGALQKEVLAANWHFNQKRSLQDIGEGEYLGFVYSKDLQKQLMAKKLFIDSPLDEIAISCLYTNDKSMQSVIAADCAESVSFSYVADEGDWLVHKDIDKSISTHKINRLVLEQLQ